MGWPDRNDLQRFLGETLIESSDQADQALTAAQSIIEDYCGRTFVVGASTHTLSGNCTRKLLLPVWPVTQVSSVAVAGQPLAIDDWWLQASAGILMRRGGVWPCGDGNITVELTGGQDLPESVRTVAMTVATRILRNPSARTSHAYEGVSEQYDAVSTGRRLLTSDDLHRLDPYREPRLA